MRKYISDKLKKFIEDNRPKGIQIPEELVENIIKESNNFSRGVGRINMKERDPSYIGHGSGYNVASLSLPISVNWKASIYPDKIHFRSNVKDRSKDNSCCTYSAQIASGIEKGLRDSEARFSNIQVSLPEKVILYEGVYCEADIACFESEWRCGSFLREVITMLFRETTVILE